MKKFAKLNRFTACQILLDGRAPEVIGWQQHFHSKGQVPLENVGFMRCDFLFAT